MHYILSVRAFFVVTHIKKSPKGSYHLWEPHFPCWSLIIWDITVIDTILGYIFLCPRFVSTVVWLRSSLREQYQMIISLTKALRWFLVCLVNLLGKHANLLKLILRHWYYQGLKKQGWRSKAEQPLQGIELQGKQAQKDLKHTGNLFRKNLQLIGVC